MKMNLALGAATLLLASHAPAQTTPGPAPAGANAPGVYRSAFEGYQPSSEEPLASWREVNETVERVGGHPGVLRADKAGSAKPPVASPAAPAPAGKGGGHGAHHPK